MRSQIILVSNREKWMFLNKRIKKLTFPALYLLSGKFNIQRKGGAS